jgi:hypothetical protein
MLLLSHLHSVDAPLGGAPFKQNAQFTNLQLTMDISLASGVVWRIAAMGTKGHVAVNDSGGV